MEATSSLTAKNHQLLRVGESIPLLHTLLPLVKETDEIFTQPKLQQIF